MYKKISAVAIAIIALCLVASVIKKMTKFDTLTPIQRQAGDSARIGQADILPTRVVNRILGDGSVDTAELKDLAVTDAKIANLTWDKGQGGTLTLGGANDVNGVLKVKDSSSNTKVTLDKDGIAITGGKISIADDGDTTIIDAKGLVSQNNFVPVNLRYYDDNNTTTETFHAIPNLATNIVVPTGRQKVVLILLNGHVKNLNTLTEIGINVGRPLDEVDVYGGHYTNADYNTVSIHYVTTLSAGTTTITGVWRSGGNQSNIDERTLTVLTLGN